MNTRLRLAILLASVCLVVALFSASALAYPTYGEVNDVVLDDMTYYDMYEGDRERPDLSAQEQFLKDAIQQNDNLCCWAGLAYQILKHNENKVAYWNHWSPFTFDALLEPDASRVGRPDGFDLMGEWSEPNRLTYANNLRDVEQAARDTAAALFGNVPASALEGIEAWQNDDRIQPVFYTYATIKDHDPSDLIHDYWFYNYMGIAFYDFQLSLLSDADLSYHSAADGYDSVKDAFEAGVEHTFYEHYSPPEGGYISGVTNAAAVPATATQMLVDTSTTRVSNSIQSSQTFTFSQMIGGEYSVGTEISVLDVTAMWKWELTAEEAFSTAYAEENSVEKSRSNEYSVEVTLPAHTGILMRQVDSVTREVLAYDSPVVVKYKVAVYSLCGKIQSYGTNEYDCRSSLRTFGRPLPDHEDAVGNLVKRIQWYSLIPGYEATYGDGLDWNAICDETEPTGERAKGAVEWLTTHMPMSVTGASIASEHQSLVSKVDSLTPLHPLRRVASDTYEFNMNSGDYLYVDNLAVEGYNAYNVAYYGFDGAYGGWTLLDSGGVNIGLGNETAALIMDDITGNTRLVAGDTSGTVYLKYQIDEEAYWENQSDYTTNADLLDTALIRVNVSSLPFAGTVVASGSIDGYAGDPAMNIDTLDTIDAAVYDATGREIAHPIVWEARQLPWRGIEVVDNQLLLTLPGTFDIRARCSSAYSEWIPVRSHSARKLDRIQIADVTDPATLVNRDITGGPAVVDLGLLGVSAFDQYEAAWADMSSLQWKCDAPSGINITGANLTVSEAGAFRIYAQIGDVRSNELQLEVTGLLPPLPLQVTAGWNLVAGGPGSDLGSRIFGWDGSTYYSPSEIDPWTGYWTKVASECTLTMYPMGNGSHTVYLGSGWNLLGNPMKAKAALTLPPGRSAFVYTPSGYASVTMLEPGQGAWIKGVEGETVVFTELPES
ncbi:MAG: hypothetical protein JXA57_17445 [Armatimonadetes bacterium]|nr:hypothetical protein [Armatimonadota bacterium]